MSSYHPGPKQLRRSRSDRYIGGVCGGVAAYLNMDATLVRILTVLITLFTGVPVVLYFVALFLMPEEDVAPARPVTGSDPVWGPGGPPWQAPGTAPQNTAWSDEPPTPDASTTPTPADPPRREDGTV